MLSLNIEKLSCAEPTSNMRGGEIVVLDSGGPMAKIQR